MARTTNADRLKRIEDDEHFWKGRRLASSSGAESGLGGDVGDPLRSGARRARGTALGAKLPEASVPFRRIQSTAITPFEVEE